MGSILIVVSLFSLWFELVDGRLALVFMVFFYDFPSHPKFFYSRMPQMLDAGGAYLGLAGPVNVLLTAVPWIWLFNPVFLRQCSIRAKGIGISSIVYDG